MALCKFLIGTAWKVRRYIGEWIKLYLHPVSTHCPKAPPISHSQTIGPAQHSCSLLLIFIYYLQLLISSESALEISRKPPHVPLRGTGKHSLLHRWQNEVNPGCAQQEPVKRATPQPQVSAGQSRVSAGPHRESGPPVPPFPSQLSPPSNPTLLHTWHFWLLFAEFVSWGSRRLRHHRHLQTNLVSSSFHAGFCGAF